MNDKLFSAEDALLASQGNRSAARRLYIACAGRASLIAGLLCPGSNEAKKKAGALLEEAFASLSDMKDAARFELSLNASLIEAMIPTASCPPAQEEAQTQRAYAEQALFKLSEGDRDGFASDVETLVARLYASLPVGEKAALLRRELARDDSASNAEKAARADASLREKAETLRKVGMDVSPFLDDPSGTLAHLAEAQTIPAEQLGRAGELLGVNVDPAAPSPEQEQALRREARSAKKAERKPAAKEDRRRRILREILLFICVTAVAFTIILIVRRAVGSRPEPRTAKPAATTAAATEAAIWDGAAADAFDGGSGTAQDPYQIASPEALAHLALAVSGGDADAAQAHYLLTADIYLNDTEDFARWDATAPANVWTPIGTRQTPFAGYFDGNDCTIYGMYARADADAGLFGCCENAQILDLNLTQGYVAGGKRVGLLAGSFGVSNGEGATIDGCVLNGVAQANETAGGVAGVLWASDGNAVVSFCEITGDVVCDSGSATVGLCRAFGKGETFITGCRFRLGAEVPPVVTAGEERSGDPAREHWADVTDIEGVG